MTSLHYNSDYEDYNSDYEESELSHHRDSIQTLRSLQVEVDDQEVMILAYCSVKSATTLKINQSMRAVSTEPVPVPNVTALKSRCHS